MEIGPTWTIIGALVGIVTLLVGPLYARILRERDGTVEDNADAVGVNSDEIDSLQRRIVRIEEQIDKLEELEDQSDEAMRRINRLEAELSLVKRDLQVIHDNVKSSD